MPAACLDPGDLASPMMYLEPGTADRRGMSFRMKYLQQLCLKFLYKLFYPILSLQNKIRGLF